MQITVRGEGQEGGQAYIAEVLRQRFTDQIRDHRIYPTWWEFTFDGDTKALIFLRKLRKESISTLDSITSLDTA